MSIHFHSRYREIINQFEGLKDWVWIPQSLILSLKLGNTHFGSRIRKFIALDLRDYNEGLMFGSRLTRLESAPRTWCGSLHKDRMNGFDLNAWRVWMRRRESSRYSTLLIPKWKTPRISLDFGELLRGSYSRKRNWGRNYGWSLATFRKVEGECGKFQFRKWARK